MHDMDGFVNTSVGSTFDYGLKHSKRYANYGVDKINPNREQQNQSNTLLGYSYDDLKNLSLPENIDQTIVDTVTTPNQNTHQRLKTAGIIGGSVLVLGGIVMLLTKGKISKSLTSGIDKLGNHIENQIQKIKQKPSISTLEGHYLSFLQKVNKITCMVQGTLFNITPLKDVLFEKCARKLGFGKQCDAITNGFQKVAFGTVKSTYKKSATNMGKMTDLFEQANARIASGEFGKADDTVIESLGKGVKKIKNSYLDSFSSTPVESRSKTLTNKFKGLGSRVYDTVYGKLKDFVTDVNEWTTFVSERLVAKDKAQIMRNLDKQRRVITNNPQDNFKSMTNALAGLDKVINHENKDSREVLKSIKTLVDKYAGLSGKNEASQRAKIIKEINQHLKSMTNLTTNGEYTSEQKRAIKVMLNNIGNALNADKKGAVEEMLSIYKKYLPKEEYMKLKAAADKATKSLNKAVYTEGFNYTDKIRDLSIGSALTDVAIGTAVPVISTGIAISAANTKEKKRSVALKYGIPLLAGISTTTLCTLKLIAGGKALMLGGAVSILSNEICERIDKHLLARDHAKQNQTQN